MRLIYLIIFCNFLISIVKIIFLNSREFDNVILEFSGEEKAGMKEIPQRAEDIVEPFNERSIYSIGNFSFESNINFLLSLKYLGVSIR